ncbi:hypothetical protein EJ06DRAFT_534861 [Trichodelitschia bisporula]|uniref:Uncharacterized protein n=1 Tax=Trichodelitschia bisporula TaxID=703511 RepID=A0A6G1HIA0_9PEZI|nr:hypothetical protein EJ06DRAFT_534861 [Trichodelitschia bisporula]
MRGGVSASRCRLCMHLPLSPALHRATSTRAGRWNRAVEEEVEVITPDFGVDGITFWGNKTR